MHHTTTVYKTAQNNTKHKDLDGYFFFVSKLDHNKVPNKYSVRCKTNVDLQAKTLKE